jgi:hypothetical protein
LGITSEVVMIAGEHTYVQGEIKEWSGVVREQMDVPLYLLPPSMTDLFKVKIFWDGSQSQQTDILVSRLEDNPVDHIKSFLDSSQDAKMANQKKIVGKEFKTYIYIKIVHAIFSANNNPQIHDNYAQYFDKFV